MEGFSFMASGNRRGTCICMQLQQQGINYFFKDMPSCSTIIKTCLSIHKNVYIGYGKVSYRESDIIILSSVECCKY